MVTTQFVYLSVVDLMGLHLSIGQILEMSLSWIRLSPSLLDLSVNFLSHQFMQHSQPMAVKFRTLYRYLTHYNNLCIPNYPPTVHRPWMQRRLGQHSMLGASGVWRDRDHPLPSSPQDCVWQRW